MPITAAPTLESLREVVSDERAHLFELTEERNALVKQRRPMPAPRLAQLNDEIAITRALWLDARETLRAFLAGL